ncbi:MAG: lipoyl synthase [Clostridia bacterium]|nr:lipoyl synthase [Clostridia bacterium]
MQSPEYVQTSLAAAMTLGLKEGSFYREAKLKALNLLLTYEQGCAANCAYCGLARLRQGKGTFIRVTWPIYPLREIISRSLLVQHQIERVCVSMVTHPRAIEDLCRVIQEVKKGTPYPVSALITPTLVHKWEHLEQIRSAGADRVGIAIDAATEPLFDQHRGQGVKGPHRWDRYWQGVREAVAVFGPFMVGIHLVAGLGETEVEMVQVIQGAHDLGAATHLFSFFPEHGTRLATRPQPPLGSYRRVQLARYLINENLAAASQMHFNPQGQITDFGLSGSMLDQVINRGDPFLTSGCPGADGTVACNRPYGNERPSQPIRNFPFQPTADDLREVREQLTWYNQG